MIVTREALDAAALVLVVDEQGVWDFTSTKKPLHVAVQLRVIADQIERKQTNGGLILP